MQVHAYVSSLPKDIIYSNNHRQIIITYKNAGVDNRESTLYNIDLYPYPLKVCFPVTEQPNFGYSNIDLYPYV